MSITKTLYTGVTGLNAHSRALGVTGDNIANVNTVGYKAERAVFSDILGRSMTAVNASGSGVQMSNITRTFAQGTLLTTESPTDLAINGKGFFIVKGAVGGQQGNYFTRAGQFRMDKDGNLVDPQGFIAQGYLVNSAGEIDNQLTDLTIANSVLPPTETTSVNMSANLDSNAMEPTGAFDADNAGTTSNFSTAITVYDSLGNAHRVDVYFRKSATANTWTWHGVVDGGEIGGTAGDMTEVASGTLTFNTDGSLQSDVTDSAWSDTFTGAAAQVVAFDFGTSLTDDPTGNGLNGTTQFASDNVIRSQDQNGYSTGELATVGILDNGDVMAIYTNGEQYRVGQVALATFEAEGDLARVGGNHWAETQVSGEARIGTANSGSAGSITSSALEQSTVDLAKEFVDLISYQRGFQANSRTITTADQLYQEAVNLKR
ncbi:MAG: flagellar hook protein FlgE [Deltaproteobacteria bacterium]|nr:flagellar hook protein FlgE [Deltaproteobacteria bacterium]